MDADHPYRLATSAEPGAPTLVELPVHWALDDWEPYNYLPGITGSGVIASPADVLARWTLELEALVDEGGLFVLTNHPFVSGRASRAAALERLIERAQAIDGLWIATCAEIAATSRRCGSSPSSTGLPRPARLIRRRASGARFRRCRRPCRIGPVGFAGVGPGEAADAWPPSGPTSR